MNMVAILFVLLSVWPAIASAQIIHSNARPYVARSDGAGWHLKGEGVVCCPCTVPCPCRTNNAPSFGHCEASLYLEIREGYYGTINLNGLQVLNTSGSCAMSYQKLAALYFDRSVSSEQQSAFMKIMASFFPGEDVVFPYIRTVPIRAEVINHQLFHVSISGTLEMIVDRNWGKADPPFPMVAASDYFSNLLQYAKNIKYVMHDGAAKLDFDYSRRQANYRNVDLGAEQYSSKSMLIQFADGKGWFNKDQLRLIHERHLTLPNLAVLRQEIQRLR